MWSMKVLEDSNHNSRDSEPYILKFKQIMLETASPLICAPECDPCCKLYFPFVTKTFVSDRSDVSLLHLFLYLLVVLSFDIFPKIPDCFFGCLRTLLCQLCPIS